VSNNFLQLLHFLLKLILFYAASKIYYFALLVYFVFGQLFGLITQA